MPTKSEHMNFKSETEKMFLIQGVYSSYYLYECLWFWIDLKYKNCNIISHTKTYKLTFKENLTCCASFNLYLSGTVLIGNWYLIISMICTVIHKWKKFLDPRCGWGWQNLAVISMPHKINCHCPLNGKVNTASFTISSTP